MQHHNGELPGMRHELWLRIDTVATFAGEVLQAIAHLLVAVVQRACEVASDAVQAKLISTPEIKRPIRLPNTWAWQRRHSPSGE